MTLDELKAEIASRKIETFDLIRSIQCDAEAKNAGFPTHEAAALGFIKMASKDIEKLIRKWERDNPD